MKTALVYFTIVWKTTGHIGGSEILLFLIIKELQERGYAVTVALQSGGDIAHGIKDYGVDIDMSRLNVVNLNERGKFLKWIDRHLKMVWQWRLKRLGSKFDICISCANIVDFGRPGIHFIYMLTLDEAFSSQFFNDGGGLRAKLRRRLVHLRNLTVAFLSGVRSPSRIARNSDETILANSNYVKRCIESYYKCHIHDAFYPPTVFVPTAPINSDLHNYDIAYIGRFEPEKRVSEIIEIVRLARERSGIDFKLHLAGRCPNNANGNRIRSFVEKYLWVNLEGTVIGEEKAKFLASCRFALHGCKVEAFGISVTEYLKAGLVPLVPREGGSSEVVGLDDLVYETNEDAAEILVRLVKDETFYENCASHCGERAKLFSAESYLERQKKLLDELGV